MQRNQSAPVVVRRPVYPPCPNCQGQTRSAPAEAVRPIVGKVTGTLVSSLVVRGLVMAQVTEQAARTIGVPYCPVCELTFVPRGFFFKFK